MHNAAHRDMLSGQHNWYACSHARPTYCNVCREALSGVTSHGLSCEVCKFKAHKRCAVRADNNCKWTTLASIGRDIIEEEDGTIAMPHQWMEGNLPVSAKCVFCDKTCGSVLRLHDWRCLWCKATIHSSCREQYSKRCPLGQCRVSILPPTAITNLDSDGYWRATKPHGTSPLLVFVNSKSGDNQGVKMLRRFKQLLNPAQVFDLINGGPKIGLRLFQTFESFRVLVCGGDGSIGWVLTEIDQLQIDKQCQVGVLPLGTGNDLARVLGWGPAFDDDTQLPAVLERMEHAQINMLDRWGIYVYERLMPPPRRDTHYYDAISAYEHSVAAHLSKILHSENHNIVISSAKVLCETVKDFVAKVGAGSDQQQPSANVSQQEEDTSLTSKCRVLNEKLDALLKALEEEAAASQRSAKKRPESKPPLESSEYDTSEQETSEIEADLENVSLPIRVPGADGGEDTLMRPRAHLMSRANSLKKAIRQIIEQTEKAVDYQNGLTESLQKIRQQDSLSRSASQTNIPNNTNFTESSKNMKKPSSIDIPIPIVVIGADDTEEVVESQNEALLTAQKEAPLAQSEAESELDEQSKATGLDSDSLESQPKLASESQRETPEEEEVVGDTATKLVISLEESGEGEKVLGSQQIQMEDDKEDGSIKIPELPAFQVDEGQAELCDGLPQVSLEVEDSGDELTEADLENLRTGALGGGSGGTSGGATELKVSCYPKNPPPPSSSDQPPTSLSPPSCCLSPPCITVQDDSFSSSSTLDLSGRNASFKSSTGSDWSSTSNTLTVCSSTSMSSSPGGNSSTGSDLSGIIWTAPVKTSSGNSLLPSEPTTGSEDEYIGKKMADGGSDSPAQSALTDLVVPEIHFTIEDDDDDGVALPAITKPLATMSSRNKHKLTVTVLDEGLSDVGDSPGPSSVTSAFHLPSQILTPSPGGFRPGGFRLPQMDSLTVPTFYSSDGDSSCPSTPGSVSPYPCSSPTPSPMPQRAELGARERSLASRRISAMSTCGLTMPKPPRGRTPEKNPRPREFPIIGVPLCSSLPHMAGSLGGSFISKVLLANADALCAAASPLMQEDISLSDYNEKCVMNNYFGIGVDAKITYDFHLKREEHPEKCRSRTKNMMWYGMIGSKEIVHKTFKNLDQKVRLECDGKRIPLPNLQGLVVLNIPSYMGGVNFWGSSKEDDIFLAPSFDDKILEVVAVFGSAQLGISRVINLHHHRIAQCRSVKITILGDEGIPVQADGEAWIQLPGFIQIVHKNRAQMLTRDKVFEEALKTWTEKQKLERPVSPIQHTMLSHEETQLLHSFVEATQVLVKSVKVAAIYHSSVEQELLHLATQASEFLERLYPAGKLSEPSKDASDEKTESHIQPAIRTQVSDLVSSVRTLYNESNLFMQEKAHTYHLDRDVAEKLISALKNMDGEMRKVYEIGGLPHFHQIENEASELRHKRKSRFRLMHKLRKGGKKEKAKEWNNYSGPNVHYAYDWGPEEVGQWLEAIKLGEYRDDFRSHDIRGRELMHLGRQDLKDLGIGKVGHLKRIQQGIKDIKSAIDR